ncbi:hypothetical protein ACFLZN_00815 [Nanoarchaeota archaeon]
MKKLKLSLKKCLVILLIENNMAADSQFKTEVLKHIDAELISKFFPLYLRESGETIVGDINNLPKISKEDNETLKKIHLCLTKEVKSFRKELELFLRNIRHTTSNILILNKGMVRGRIDWKLTYQTRHNGGFNDPSLFSCRESTKDYTIPENIILKKLIVEIKKIITETDILKGIASESEQQKRWTTEITLLKGVIDRVEKNVYFKKINISWINFDLQSSRLKSLIKKSRHKFYRETLLNAYNLWAALITSKISKANEELFKKVIKETLIGTKNDDEKYELYALWKILEIFQNKIKNIRPLGLHNSEVAKFNLNSITITIYYQNLPADFKGENYKKIVSYYKILDNPRSRSPDIIIKFEKPGKKTEYLIIEVKWSDDRNYILESIYKVFGYLKDFYIDDLPHKKDAVLLVLNWATSEEKYSLTATENSLPIKVLKFDNYSLRIKEIITNFEENRQFINI